MSDKPEALLQRMQEAAQGHEEWRVQNPETGAYCIAYSRNDGYSLGDPERAARKWLADHQAQFPGSASARYVVACVKVQTHHQRLLDDAAAELRRLHAECEEWRKLRDPATLHVNLLRGIPARLDDATLWHMAGGDQKMGELRDECERLRVDATFWQSLYRRAVNQANGLTNYVEDRPELRSAERKLDAIQAEARAHEARKEHA